MLSVHGDVFFITSLIPTDIPADLQRRTVTAKKHLTRDVLTLQIMCARRSLTWLQVTGYCLPMSRLNTTLMTSSIHAGYFFIIVSFSANLNRRDRFGDRKFQ